MRISPRCLCYTLRGFRVRRNRFFDLFLHVWLHSKSGNPFVYVADLLPFRLSLLSIWPEKLSNCFLALIAHNKLEFRWKVGGFGLYKVKAVVAGAGRFSYYGCFNLCWLCSALGGCSKYLLLEVLSMLAGYPLAWKWSRSNELERISKQLPLFSSCLSSSSSS